MKLTRRGRRARAVILILFALYTLGKVSSNLWWTDSGYCWGDYVKCYPIEEGNK